MIPVRTIAIAGLLLLSGCTLIPDYVRPAAPAPQSWPTGPSYLPASASGQSGKLADIAWEDYFNDDKLRRVIALALQNNRDLRVAALNIEEAQAQYRISRSDLFPSIDAEGSGEITRSGRRNTLSGRAETTRTYSANVIVSAYELDLFGRIRSLNEQALEDYFSTVETRRATQISLVAEVATAYLTLQADQAELKLARETLESQQHSLDLTRQTFEKGIASALDVRQAETSVDTARVDIAQFTTAVAQDLNALVLLAGAQVPSDLLPGDTVGPVTAMTDVPGDLPSDVLTSRPDILAAEHTLKSANANIGAARAAFFPKITLTAASGSTSDALATLFKAGTGGWSFAPDIILPIFDAGANQANLDAAKVEKRIEVANYEKTIQTAFREVADALAERGTIDEQLAAQQSLVDSTEASYRLATERYQRGISSYLDVLDSQRSLYAAQQELISIQLSREANLVTLYKVLGGGWSSRPEKSTASASES
ncbi:MAG TPA: efflux transporter outer membrane subunit [Dongiaceae bacterium]|jgi:multidrug efflux system outer membrane protein|nr:efflux transporter outer membrane subunit [Dongiaceae bacterium]